MSSLFGHPKPPSVRRVVLDNARRGNGLLLLRESQEITPIPTFKNPLKPLPRCCSISPCGGGTGAPRGHYFFPPLNDGSSPSLLRRTAILPIAVDTAVTPISPVSTNS